MAQLDLAQALTLAMDLAKQAGGKIREEFHRTDGPRNRSLMPAHADVDREIEEVIRDCLVTTFPYASFLGEETGAVQAVEPHPDGVSYCWVVDPQDGTAGFLAGRRDSSVSIGLLCDGEPVLGVVYAPNAPTGRGDLIAWAKGQPLTRNGVVVHRKELPQELHQNNVIIMSAAARDHAERNLLCIAPSRMRTVASCAYRLALVAVGEASAATALTGPNGWDIAAGHALIRAVGGELLDQNGQAVRYTFQGKTELKAVFAGSINAARKLSAIDWSSVFGAKDELSEFEQRYPWSVLKPGNNEKREDVLGRAQGVLWGQVAGDALGGLVEFSSPAGILRKYPDGVRNLADGGTWGTLAGQPTDDSEMALMLARSIVTHGSYGPEAAFRAYVAWRDSGPFDMGGTTRMALRGTLSMDSQANGSLMRVSPLAVYAYAMTNQEIAALARADSGLTHPHPACLDACAVFCIAIAHAIRTGENAQECYDVALGWAKKTADESVVKALKRAENEKPEDYTTQQGWVITALQNAFYQFLHAETLEEGVMDTVMQGGDTDTNAAIAGALLGAVHGEQNVPLRWKAKIAGCRPLRGITGVKRARPRPFWPVDLPELAEQLLLLGTDHAQR